MRRAFIFDLDGTITRDEILPLIAAEIGLEEEIRDLTDLTMRGVIPFEASFKMRFAMLRSVSVAKVRAAICNVVLDKEITEFIRSNLQHCYIATGNLQNWIEPLIEQLQCKVFCNTADEKGGYLTKLHPLILKSVPVIELKSTYEQVIAIGDGANDVPMFEAADIGIAFGGVHKPDAGLLNIADYIVYESRALCRLLNTL